MRNSRLIFSLCALLFCLSIIEYYRFSSAMTENVNKEKKVSNLVEYQGLDFSYNEVLKNLEIILRVNTKAFIQKIYYSSLMRWIDINHYSLYKNADRLNILIEGDEYVYFIDNQKQKRWLPYYGLQVNSKAKIKGLYLNERGDTSKVKISSTGKNADHYELGRGWSSFKIKFGKSNNKFGRKAQKNVLVSSARLYERGAFANILFKNLCDGIQIQSEPVVPVINGQEYFGFLMEDGWDKFLIERNFRRDGSIFTLGFNGNGVENTSEYLDFNHKVGDVSIIQEFADSLYHGIIPLEKIDRFKLDCLILLCYDFFGGHPLVNMNLHWYYNPVSGLFEPTLREAEFKGSYLHRFQDKQSSLIANYMQLVDFDIDEMRLLYYPNFNRKIVDNELKLWQKNLSDETKSDIKLLESYSVPNRKKRQLTESINSDTIFFRDSVYIDSRTVIKKNQVLVISDSCNVFFKGKESVLWVSGAIICKNTEFCSFEAPNGGSLYFEGAKPKNLKKLKFSGFSNLRSRELNLPSALTFYETIVSIDSCIFDGNIIGDDFINTFRCEEVSITNSHFIDSYADAYDSDFSNIFISNCYFIQTGNDAVDISGTIGEVINCRFELTKDKAISAGENSFLTVNICEFERNELAIVSKDGSKIVVNNTNFSDNELDLVSYRKKLEYNDSELYIYSSEPYNALIEERVKTNINVVRQSDVTKLMYGNVYGKSSR